MAGDGGVQWQKLAFAVGLSIALLMKAVESRIPESTLQNLINHTCSSDTLPTTKSWQTEHTALEQLGSNLVSASSAQISSNSSAESGGETVFGAYQCRGDLSSTECNGCVFAAFHAASRQCSTAVNARIDLEACSFFYQDTSIAPDFTIKYYWRNENTTYSNVFIANRRLVLGKVIDAAPSAPHYYATSDDGGVYAMAQCFGFFTPETCAACLSRADQSMETLVYNPGNQVGTRLMLGSCSLRYENYLFLNPTPSGSTVSVAVPSGMTKAVPSGMTKSRVGIVVVAVVLASMVLFACWRKGKRSEQGHTRIPSQEPHNDNNHIELQEQSIQIRSFPLVQLREATGDFHQSSELGKGGFGSVYKGTLQDGQAIAIKKMSALGEYEDHSFLAKVRTITNVRHANLIKLIGFCLDCSDKYLIYEFMPQKSLDKHIFGAEAERALPWNTRRKIILGTAKGLRYLHHNKTVRIIHLDIKAANILLDEKLEPKCDFGLAKLFDFSQTHAVTEMCFRTPCVYI